MGGHGVLNLALHQISQDAEKRRGENVGWGEAGWRRPPTSLSCPSTPPPCRTPPPPDPSLVLPPCHSLAGAYCVARNILLGHLQCQRLGEARDA